MRYIWMSMPTRMQGQVRNPPVHVRISLVFEWPAC